MNVQMKHSPTYVISLNEKEAMMLREILNRPVLGGRWSPDVHDQLSEFATGLWRDVSGLIEDLPYLDETQN